MEEDLRDHLIAAAALTALVGQKIQWSARDEAPSVALYLIDAPKDWHLKGASGLVQARVQGDCLAADFLSAKAIGEALTDALPAIGAVIGQTKFLTCVVLDTDRDLFGAAPNILHRTRIDFRVSFRPA